MMAQWYDVDVDVDVDNGGGYHMFIGYMFNASSALCRSLLSNTCSVLNHLGTQVPFEIAVGVNGRVWINSARAEHTILLANAVIASEGLNEQQTAQLIQNSRSFASTSAMLVE
jgi:exosome complex RNA-binding protein Rrp4